MTRSVTPACHRTRADARCVPDRRARRQGRAAQPRRPPGCVEHSRRRRRGCSTHRASFHILLGGCAVVSQDLTPPRPHPVDHGRGAGCRRPQLRLRVEIRPKSKLGEVGERNPARSLQKSRTHLIKYLTASTGGGKALREPRGPLPCVTRSAPPLSHMINCLGESTACGPAPPTAFGGRAARRRPTRARPGEPRAARRARVGVAAAGASP